MSASLCLIQMRMGLRAMRICPNTRLQTSGEAFKVIVRHLLAMFVILSQQTSSGWIGCCVNVYWNCFHLQCVWQAWPPLSVRLWTYWEECGAVFQLCCQTHLWWQSLSGWYGNILYFSIYIFFFQSLCLALALSLRWCPCQEAWTN